MTSPLHLVQENNNDELLLVIQNITQLKQLPIKLIIICNERVV